VVLHAAVDPLEDICNIPALPKGNDVDDDVADTPAIHIPPLPKTGHDENHSLAAGHPMEELDSEKLLREAIVDSRNQSEWSQLARKRRRRLQWGKDMRTRLFREILTQSAVDPTAKIPWTQIGESLKEPPNVLRNHFERCMSQPGLKVAYSHLLDECVQVLQETGAMPVDLSAKVDLLLSNPATFTKSSHVQLPASPEEFFRLYHVVKRPSKLEPSFDTNLTPRDDLIDECVKLALSDVVHHRQAVNDMLLKLPQSDLDASIERLKEKDVLLCTRSVVNERNAWDWTTNLAPRKSQSDTPAYSLELHGETCDWRQQLDDSFQRGQAINLDSKPLLNGGTVAATLARLSQKYVNLELDLASLETSTHYDNARGETSLRAQVVNHHSKQLILNIHTDAEEWCNGPENVSSAELIDTLAAFDVVGTNAKKIVDLLQSSSCATGLSVETISAGTELPVTEILQGLNLLLGTNVVVRLLLEKRGCEPNLPSAELFALRDRVHDAMLGKEGVAPRPWRAYDGSDRPDRAAWILCAVLSVVISKPGITTRNIASEVGHLALSDGALMEVLSILEAEGRVEGMTVGEEVCYSPTFTCLGRFT